MNLPVSYKYHFSTGILEWLIWVGIIYALYRYANPDYFPYILFTVAGGLVIRIVILSQFRIDVDETGFTYRGAFKDLRFNWSQIKRVEAKWLTGISQNNWDAWSKYLLIYSTVETVPRKMDLVHFNRGDLRQFIQILRVKVPRAVVDDGFLERIY